MASAAPGTGTAIPARAATCRACSTPTPGTTSCRRSGAGPRSTPPSRRSSRYANHVADRYDLRPLIAFETRVLSATFDEAADRWTRGHRPRRRAFAPAGWSWPPAASRRRARRPSPASRASPARPTTPAPGRMRASTSPARRVAVIGTGSSGIQSIPQIAAQADHVTVFQRTANYSVPANNTPLTDKDIEDFWKMYPAYIAMVKGPGMGFGGNPRRTPWRRRRRSAAQALRGVLGRRRRRLPGRLGRHHHRHRGQRPRPPTSCASKIGRDGQGPEDGRGAEAARPPDRHQAHLRRYRLLRDLQPAERDAGEPASETPIEEITPNAVRTSEATYRGRRHRLRHRLRRHDRRAAGHRHQGRRRTAR